MTAGPAGFPNEIGRFGLNLCKVNITLTGLSYNKVYGKEVTASHKVYISPPFYPIQVQIQTFY
jgi:hypothetical protein